MDKEEAQQRGREAKREDPDLRYRTEPLTKDRGGPWCLLIWDKNPMGWGYLEYDASS